MLAVQRVLAAG